MGLNPLVILTKKEKFRRLLNDIYNFSRVQSFFKGVYPNLEAHFTEQQKKKYTYLMSISKDSLEDNDSQFDAYIREAVSFLKDILTLIEKPIIFANNREMNPFEDRYSFIHNPEHDGSHLGSLYATESPKGEIIRKLDKSENKPIYGYIKRFDRQSYNIAPWLEEMGKGLYTINGYRFDVGRMTSFAQNYFTDITIYYEDQKEHPLLKYIEQNSEEIEEYEPVSCTTCGDGGCWHCEPHRFI